MMTPNQLVNHTPDTWNAYIERLRSVFPLELLKMKIWLRWYGKPDGDRVQKVPVSTYDKPENYLTFSEASRFRPGFQGLGIANVNQPFTICDMDDYTGKWNFGKNDELYPSIFTPDTAANYCAHSPSGKGLRWFYSGAMPEGPSVRVIANVEIYRAKWATVTGDLVSPRRARARILPIPDTLAHQWLLMVQADSLGESSEEGGCWTMAFLREHLEAWRKFSEVPFKFEQSGDKFMITCPGDYQGWNDGNKHTHKRGQLSLDAVAWVRNGLPVFNCFHAHCREKTWKDLQNYYDAEKLWHSETDDMDEFQERQMAPGEYIQWPR
jgi:hypothetical protein